MRRTSPLTVTMWRAAGSTSWNSVTRYTSVPVSGGQCPAHLRQHMLAPRAQRLDRALAGAASAVGQPYMLEKVVGDRGRRGIQPLGCDDAIGCGEGGVERDVEVAAVELQQRAQRCCR